MVEVGARDTLQPALLDRLTDNDPAHRGRGAPARAFRARDGYVSIALSTGDEYARFCRVLGDDSLLTEPRFATRGSRLVHHAELKVRVERVLAQGQVSEWVERLVAASLDAKPEVESRQDRVISRSQLRALVLRDLAWLFNTTNLVGHADLEPYPLVAASTINYGIAPLSGKVVSSLDLADLEQTLREAIVRFEPRILPRTLTVRAIEPGDDMAHHNVVSFQITGQLWAQPYPLELLLKTEVDLESGEIRIAEGR